LLYLLLVLFPGHYAPIKGGLDESWVYEINHLSAESKWTGVVFTYGPLGYLLYPRDLGHNLIVATIFQLLIHMLFAGLIFYYSWQIPSPITILFFVAGYTLAATLGLIYDYHLLIVFTLLVCLKFRSWPWQAGSAILSGLLAAMFLFMKFNIGVVAAGVLAVVSLNYLFFDLVNSVPGVTFTDRLKSSLSLASITRALRAGQAQYFVIPVAAAYLFTLIGIGLVYLAPLANFVEWLRYSLNIAGQYSLMQSIIGPQDITTMGLLLSGIFAVTGVWLASQDGNLRTPLLALAVIGFFAFKGGFVRQDGHELNFFPTVVAALSVLFLFIRYERMIKWNGLSLLLAVGLSLPVVLHYGYITSSGTVAHFLGRQGWRQVQNLLHFSDTRRSLEEQSAANFEPLQAPEAWLEKIGGHTIEVLPFLLAVCPANQFNCQPNPLLQPYAGGSKTIDTWNAMHYAGPNAPDYLLVEFVDIDDRHPLWGLPVTWQTILQHYRPVEMLPQFNLLLLEKQAAAKSANNPIPLEKTSIKLNEWVEVPAANHPLLAGLELRLGWWGQVRKILFRIPEVTVDVQTVSGETRTYRLVPDTASNGILLNFLPEDLHAFNDLLRGHFPPTEAIVRFRISGPGSSYFQPNGSLIWYKFDLPVSSLSAVYGQPLIPAGHVDYDWAGGAEPVLEIVEL